MRMKRFLLSCLSCSMLSGAGAAETVNLAADAEISSRANPDRVELIRDGRLDRDHTLPGSIYLEKPAGWGDEITLRWPEAKRITGVAAFRAAPAAFPEYADADRIEVFAADAAGNFSIPVVLAVPGEWRAEKFNGQAAEVLRYDELNVATTALQVKFLRPGGTWSQLGELEVYGGPAGDFVPEERRAAAPEIQPLPDSPAVIAAGDLVVWSENPWRDTKGGTLGVPDAPLLGNWTMPMLRGDIEQKMIGISNRSDAPVTFRVAAASTLPENTAKCDLLVVTPIKTREHGDALLNLFAADQLRRRFWIRKFTGITRRSPCRRVVRCGSGCGLPPSLGRALRNRAITPLPSPSPARTAGCWPRRKSPSGYWAVSCPAIRRGR